MASHAAAASHEQESAAPALRRRVSAVLAALMLVGVLCFNFVGGTPVAYLIMALLLLAVLWSSAWRQPVWRFWSQPSRPMFAAAFLLVAIAFAASAQAPADLRYIGNFVMLLFFVCASTFFSQMARPGNIGIVATLALAGALLSFVTALIEVRFLHQPRALGWGSDPIWSAEAALVAGFLAITGFFAGRAPLPRLIYLLGPVLAALTVWLTGSRGPTLAFLPLAFVAMAFIGRKALLAVLGMLAVAGVLLLLLHLVQPLASGRPATTLSDLVTLFTSGQIKDTSAAIRLLFWRLGASAFLDAPIFGHGWAHFLSAAYSFLPDFKGPAVVAVHRLKGNIHLHADILDMAASAGVFGILAYVLVLAAPIVDAWTSPQDSQYLPRRVGSVLLSIGYLSCGLTYLMFGYEFHTTLYVMLAAILLSFCRDAPALDRRRATAGATPSS